MKRLLPYGLLAVLALLVGLLARTAPARMPQALAGGDFLSVLLGDAKKDISGAMLREADSYFHGGVDMDCHHLHEHHDHDHAHHDHHSEEERDHEETASDGNKAVEMMPWFWVAVKSDPHNVEAWSTAWYAASHMMKDDALALRIATEGQRLNPESLEMTCVLGRAYRAEATRNQDKSEEMFHKVLELARMKRELEDGDELPLCSALGYLADSAKHRNDRRELAVLLNAARRFAPNHPITSCIERMLAK